MSSNASANTAFAFGNPSPSCTKKLFSCQPVHPVAEQKSPTQLRDEISEANQVILSPWRSPDYKLTTDSSMIYMAGNCTSQP
jgi:hypothetical protein